MGFNTLHPKRRHILLQHVQHDADRNRCGRCAGAQPYTVAQLTELWAPTVFVVAIDVNTSGAAGENTAIVRSNYQRRCRL
jgi:hypothetical protein